MFIWEETISVGKKIEEKIFSEIRLNVDYIDDTKCSIANSSYLSTADSINDILQDSSIFTDKDAVILTAENVTADDVFYTTNNGPNRTYDSTDFGTVRGTANLSVSSKKFKNTILEINEDEAMELIKSIVPVSFKFNWENTLDYGFIAEDIEKINHNFVIYDKRGNVIGLKYYEFIPFIIKILKMLVEKNEKK